MKRLTFVLSVTFLFALSTCVVTDKTYNDSDLSGVAGSEAMMKGMNGNSDTILDPVVAATEQKSFFNRDNRNNVCRAGDCNRLWRRTGTSNGFRRTC